MHRDHGEALAAAFSSLVLHIESENLTSRTWIEGEIGLEELREKSLVLSLPSKSCNHDHKLLLRITARSSTGGPAALKFESTARITEIETLEDGSLRAVVELLQFEEAEWQHLLELYSERQDEITSFLLQTKG